jgi:SAM-dependent methyltransferase
VWRLLMARFLLRAFLDKVKQELFRCPACAGYPITFSPKVAYCHDCSWKAKIESGVIDFVVGKKLDPAANDDRHHGASIENAVMARLGFAGQTEEIAAVKAALAPVHLIGHSFFDAEEMIFLDRFAIKNFEPRLGLSILYLPNRTKTGANFQAAVRVKNLSAFPVSSEGENPVLLSYHWYQGNHLVEFEGIRSSLQIDILPDMEVTVPIQLKAPHAPGSYRLQVLPVQEHVRWMDESVIDGQIIVDKNRFDSLPDRIRGETFSEHYDGQLAAEFIDQHFSARPNGTVVEIGGGIRPCFQDSKIGAAWYGTFINSDVSIKLLRIAALLDAKRGNYKSLQIRLDANQLPLPDESVDVVMFCRAIHHFEDLNVILREVARVLKVNGQLFLLCEPIGFTYDDWTKQLIRSGVNEQVFPSGIYERVASEAGLSLVAAQVDWTFSFKGVFEKKQTIDPMYCTR